MAYTVCNEDVIEWAKRYRGEKYHALLCDPPYHLTSIVKRFGKPGSAPAQYGTDGVFARASKGFMGKVWDGGDIAFNPETWYALGEHLYPGAFGMAFASSRGWHRLAVAIEDGGFIIHPSLFGWATSQGFPKATNISKQIDRDAGHEQTEIVREGVGYEASEDGNTYGHGLNAGFKARRLKASVTQLAKEWEGHRYGLQALSPSLEPIIVFQKPYEGRPLDNITETGAGALWIDGARIEGEPVPINRLEQWSGFGQVVQPDYEQEINNKGRWPKNLILLDDGAAEALDRQSGETSVTGNRTAKSRDRWSVGQSPLPGQGGTNRKLTEYPGDSGGASRFFFRVREQLDEADPVRYVPKASKRERDAGCDGMEEHIVLIGAAGHEINPMTGLPVVDLPRRNFHPTVKPLALTEYLARLLLPPSAYAPRRLLVPFCGSGSEMIGGHLAGWEEITGIDTEAEYCTIAEARLAYWCKPAKQDFLFTL